MIKSSKAAVHYTDHAANHKERCALCVYFEAKNACRIVLGKIAPGGWCEEFRRAASDR